MRLSFLISALLTSVPLLALSGCSDAAPPSPVAGSGGNAGASPSPASGGTSGAAGGSGGMPSTSGGSANMAGSGGQPMAAGPCTRTGAWESSEQYATQNLHHYFIRNNMWNSMAPGAGSQKIWALNPRCWGVDASHTDAAPKGTVKSYPDIARGWVVSQAGFRNSKHGLAIQVSQLTKAKIRWKMKAPTSGRTWALWDIYFHENTSPGAGLAPVNLMIQQRIVDSDGWMQQDSSSWPKVTIAGYTFREKREISTVSSTRNRIQLYVDVTSGSVLGVDDMTLDLKAVIDHYVQQGPIKSTDYLTSIQAGWEIVSGGTYQTDDFWTAVQDEPDLL